MLIQTAAGLLSIFWWFLVNKNGAWKLNEERFGMKTQRLVFGVAAAWTIGLVVYLMLQETSGMQSVGADGRRLCGIAETLSAEGLAFYTAPESGTVNETTINEKLTFVTLSTANDIAQFEAAVTSFCEFFDFDGLDSWLVVVPDKDVALYDSLPHCHHTNTTASDTSTRSTSGTKTSIPFVIVKESLLVPSFADPNATPKVRGYLKQMLLKLAVASFIKASKNNTDTFYLVLDSDVYAHTFFTVRDLFLSKKQSNTLRAKIDLEHPVYANPESWFKSSAQVLDLLPLRSASIATCASGKSASWPAIAATTRGTRISMRAFNVSSPFSAVTASAPQCAAIRIVPACLGTRDLNIGFTPMILHTAPITKYLIPRLESLYIASKNGVDIEGKVITPLAVTTWTDALLWWHHKNFVDLWYLRIWRALGGADKVVSWTEYSLYFWSAVDSGMFDTLHAVSTFGVGDIDSVGAADSAETGILEYNKSIMNFEDYDKADWGKMFDASETNTYSSRNNVKRPFLIVHSWMRIPLDEINAKISPHVGELRALLSEKKIMNPLAAATMNIRETAPSDLSISVPQWGMPLDISAVTFVEEAEPEEPEYESNLVAVDNKSVPADVEQSSINAAGSNGFTVGRAGGGTNELHKMFWDNDGQQQYEQQQQQQEQEQHEQASQDSDSAELKRIRIKQLKSNATNATVPIVSALPSKQPYNEQGERVYCICRQIDNGRFMIQCDQCKDWYHGACVNITERMGQTLEGYECPYCIQSKNGATFIRKYQRITNNLPLGILLFLNGLMYDGARQTVR
ncbi:hypothetical protein HK100_002281 [Physocladia obscura]|uniref:PHD-type domain-containing protein n=1 Tax=Physocladia obscura TaxID=109957 RepID=A0AAD5SVL7_9FUNG|nr:hypothetical protein HK100_002281 [Physocladia obscura]